jgi:hypothetical protein
MHITRLLSSLIVIATLSACAMPSMPSDYHEANFRGGFSEAQVGNTVFRVTYKGNVTQKQSETDELALLRSAEVAQQHGYGYFISGGNASTGTALALFSGAVTVPATTLTIYCYPYRPETSSLVYEADQVIATLGPKYRRL